ncbi:VanZ family protein [Streptomyces sp. JJ66]|uniref:VanZ family protein n=1 Tax=Streptomyces sp. JJ66 TaxID=2803843 RepID=UPI0027E37C2B|nr:VanZ family protein [Streptomyces sp. JJ66]
MAPVQPWHTEGSTEGGAALRVRSASRVLLVGYLVVAGALTLRPRTVPWVEPANVTVFATLRTPWASGPREALTALGGDLLLLAPLGVLLPLASGALRPWLASFLRTVTAVAALACLLEVTRTSVPGQTGNVDAVLLNTVGAGVAQLALYPVLRGGLRRLAAREPAARATVTVRRREESGRPPFRRAEDTPGGRTPRAARVGIAP